ncbi:MAG: hypothetical protein HC806_05520 [Anaerolineae bacterium]|nr:hypothetical protein [Anaerolineae bacterium]
MPGTDWRKIEKAATELDADSVCLDLEDGVALNAKAEARETVVRALQTLDFRRSEKLVRINAMDSGSPKKTLPPPFPRTRTGSSSPRYGAVSMSNGCTNSFPPPNSAMAGREEVYA